MIKYEVNKVTKKDIDISVADALRYVLKNNEYNISPNKIKDSMYVNRNYTIPYLTAESILSSNTNLMQIKDLPRSSIDERFITKDTIQNIGKVVFNYIKVSGNTNGLRKKDLSIERFKPIFQAAYTAYVNTSIVYFPIGANYVSDNNPSELLKGTWELKAETKIGKIWERVL